MSGPESKPRRAVALRYDGTGAPRVTAKGDAWIAEEILAVARANGIPVHDDPVLVELLARVELDAEIPELLWQTVAEILVFVAGVDGSARAADAMRSPARDGN